MLLFTGIAHVPSNATAPPAAGADPVIDEHFGAPVTDRHRHLENLEDPQVQAWLRQQANASAATLAAIPGRARMLARIRDLDQAAAFTVSQPQRLAHGDIFFLKQAADEDVARLWVREADTGADSLLIDPDTLPRAMPDQHVAIDGFAASPDGRYVLYTCAADVAWKKVCDRCDAVRSFSVAGDAILLVTTGGPAHAVVRVDLAAPAFAEAETVCDSVEQIVRVIESLEGNLTGCIYSDTRGSDDGVYDRVADATQQRVGRLLNDKMPTGVAVSPAMNHGGPSPATSHPGFTAVGIPASMLRFGKLTCYDAVRERQ